jgi:hypothetical protein
MAPSKPRDSLAVNPNDSTRDENPDDEGADSAVESGRRSVTVLGQRPKAPKYVSWSKLDDSKNTLYPFYF